MKNVETETKKALTEKQQLIGKILIKYNTSINVYQFISENKQELQQHNISTEKINSVNATLASIVSKDFATKEKKAYNDKVVTYYKANDNLINLLKENN